MKTFHNGQPLSQELKLNRSKEPQEKLILRNFKISPDLDRQLSEFSRQTGISRSRVIRDGIVMALVAKQPILEAARA